MIITPRESIIEILCPAKVNLYLEVKGKRPDGYHELETLMQTVSIYDRLVLTRSDAGIEIKCSDAVIPCGPENTVWRAAEEVRLATGCTGGVSVLIEKRIPAGGGLGGGSSDAAGMIAGLNLLWKLGLSKARMEEIGRRVGSDVPFFFTGAAAVCRGRGELVTAMDGLPEPLHLVVVYPGFRVSTREVYGRLKMDLTVYSVDDNMCKLTNNLRCGKAMSIVPWLFNRLERTAAEVCPELDAVKRAMARVGLLGVTMSGSGSCFFGLCERKEVAIEKAEHLVASGVAFAIACESTRE